MSRMYFLRNALRFWMATGSLRPVVVYLFNTGAMAARSRARIRRFRTTEFLIEGKTYVADSWDGLIALRVNHETAVNRAVSHIAERCRGTGIFVNVGAHVGRYALEFAEHFALTYAVEPTPDTFRLLTAGVALHPARDRIRSTQVCIGEESGTVLLTLSHDESQNSIVEGSDSFETIPVPMTTLDELIPAGDDRDVLLLLIDAEGSEQRVLQGGQRLLTRGSPAIILELLTPKATSDCHAILGPLGYAGELLDGRNWLFRRGHASAFVEQVESAQDRRNC